jgi:predicted SnoaL-like aldol condensation-catalyzing enzyme
MSTADNKAMVVAFYQMAFNDGQPEKAAGYLGDTYIQHNPQAVDGPEGFVSYVRQMRGRFPELRLEIERVLGEGDLVVTHSRMNLVSGDRGVAIADFWRIADGKIVEHWDVIQQVPESSANSNTMF